MSTKPIRFPLAGRHAPSLTTHMISQLNRIAEQAMVVHMRVALGAKGEYRYCHQGGDVQIASICGAITGILASEDAMISFEIGGMECEESSLRFPMVGSSAGSMQTSRPKDAILRQGDILLVKVKPGQTAAQFADLSIALSQL